MSDFTSKCIKVILDDRRNRFYLIESLTYYVGHLGSADHIVVPPDFDTDFSSIPRPLWLINAPWEHGFARPGVVHDHLYRMQDRPRKECDRIFREALLVAGVSKRRARAAYMAVRLGGRRAWSKYSKRLF